MEDCGFMIFDVNAEDLELAMEAWAFEGALSCPVSKIYDSDYAVFRIRGGVVAVVIVDRWIREPGNADVWQLEFSAAAYADGKTLPGAPSFTGSKWGTKSQVEELDPVIENPELVREKPDPFPLKLGLADATQALAQHFDIDTEKVRIQIHN